MTRVCVRVCARYTHTQPLTIPPCPHQIYKIIKNWYLTPPTPFVLPICNVTVPPSVTAPNQLVGARQGDTNIILECNCESFPRPVVYWLRHGSADVVVSGSYIFLSFFFVPLPCHVWIDLLIELWVGREGGNFCLYLQSTSWELGQLRVCCINNKGNVF